jgi:hypothetical protein
MKSKDRSIRVSPQSPTDRGQNGKGLTNASMPRRDDDRRNTLVEPQISLFERCYEPIGVDLVLIEIALQAVTIAARRTALK